MVEGHASHGDSGSMLVRLLIFSRDCGAVVGKGGENLSRLRQKYSVNVQMPSTQSPERVFNMEGDVDNCLHVVNELFSYCSKSPYPVGQNTEKELNLLVHTECIGFVLGKGGARIKEIRETANANIKVYQDCLPNSSERVIAIGADSAENVLSALKQILNILSDAPRVSTPWHYVPDNNSCRVMENMSSRMQSSHDPWKAAAPNNGGGNNMMTGGYSTQTNNEYGTQRDAAGEYFRGNDFANNPGQKSAFLQAETETKLIVPNDICGAIIGKGGIRIREIRTTSGAKISFSESNKEVQQERIITITGTQQQVQSAEHLMTHAVRNRSN